ncbi:MAG: lytic transglycosylase domain-containing protein [Planctomycetes bacterium]|nr:lytic transglycosylase domain-containing protein [Planctomycetota bacterium]
MKYLLLTLFLAVGVIMAGAYILSDQAVTPLEQSGPVIDIDELARALIHVESDGKVNCRGRKGERGLMQIRRNTWNWACKKLLKVKWDFNTDGFDRAKNIIVGKTYLTYLAERLKSEEAVICAYNCGITKYLNNQVPPFTLEYLQRVKNIKQEVTFNHETTK